MLPPSDVLDKNPLRLMTEFEIGAYYNDHIFKFHTRELSTEEDTAAENATYNQLMRMLNLSISTMKQVRAESITEVWDDHTDVLHNYYQNRTILENYYICKNKAFLKLLEIFEKFNMERLFQKATFKSFHLCEGPGYFLDAIYYTWIRMKREKKIDPNNKWEWGANTLNPYFEGTEPMAKLLDDSHMRGFMRNWYFGEEEDGDITKMNEDYFIKMNLAGSFDLVTGDAGIYSEMNPGALEEDINPILLAEIDSALTLLRKGGVFILKVWRFTEESLRRSLLKLANNFTKITAFKPMASRPGSAEKYLICEGFNEGKCPMDLMMLMKCDRLYVEQQIGRIRLHIELFTDPHSMPFTVDHRKEFLVEMRERVFTADFAEYKNDLFKMFPSGPRRRTSPWIKMYGNNLARRLRDASHPRMDSWYQRKVDNYLLSYPNTSAFFGCPDLDYDSIIDRMMMKDKLLVTAPLDSFIVKDTMFLDPVVFRTIRSRREGHDLFVPTCYAALEYPLWREHFMINYKARKLPLITGMSAFNILTALIEGYDDGMNSFEFRPFYSSSLLTSRLSASFFILMTFMFEKGLEESGYNIFRWEKLRKSNNVRFLMDRLYREMQALPDHTRVFSFVPLKVLDQFHERIVNANVRLLTNMRRQHVRCMREMTIHEHRSQLEEDLRREIQNQRRAVAVEAEVDADAESEAIEEATARLNARGRPSRLVDEVANFFSLYVQQQ